MARLRSQTVLDTILPKVSSPVAIVLKSISNYLRTQTKKNANDSVSITYHPQQQTTYRSLKQQRHPDHQNGGIN